MVLLVTVILLDEQRYLQPVALSAFEFPTPPDERLKFPDQIWFRGEDCLATPGIQITNAIFCEAIRFDHDADFQAISSRILPGGDQHGLQPRITVRDCFKCIPVRTDPPVIITHVTRDEVNDCLFYTQCNSLCTAVCNTLDKPVQDAFEFFVGGFAGWKQAVTALNQQELININVCHAIDLDPESCNNYRLNHCSDPSGTICAHCHQESVLCMHVLPELLASLQQGHAGSMDVLSAMPQLE